MATTRAAFSRRAELSPGSRGLGDLKNDAAGSLIMNRKHSSWYQQDTHNRTAQQQPFGQRKVPQAGQSSYVPDKRGAKTQTQLPPRNSSLKRKRKDAIEDATPIVGHKKRSQALLASDTEGRNVEVSAVEESDPIEYWRREGRWPRQLFEIDDKTRAYIARDLNEERWLRDFFIPNMEQAKHGLGHIPSILARERSSSSVRRKKSDAGSSADTSTPSDQKPRESKSSVYIHPGFPTLLQTYGSFLKKDREGIAKESKATCQSLFEAVQPCPVDSLFSDDLFESTCEEVQDRNEAKVIQDIARLIVPSARHLAIHGAKHLDCLTESVNEGWNNSIPLLKPRPQPDYAVGFGRSAFTDEQLARLAPFIGKLTDTSMFIATFYMYFPFLTCEVKCGAAALDIADRQNAHSMTLAVRGIVELFRLVKREKELNRQILAFSVSHDHRNVRIYGHYPVIKGDKTSFYRHPIHEFSFVALDGKEKWTTYKFTKNVYDVWMPEHLKRICSVIDKIPADVSFEMSQQSDLQFQDTGLSQDLESYSVAQSTEDSTSLQGGASKASVSNAENNTPDTSVSQSGPFKKPRKRRM
ncbi:hypothetical protein EJ05DRAFT_487261 [Pseudovirgaria hyperparasitica]|uniref:DUF7924 domain-containing protein n=1 Tax=Pseudovirgaria hyperparasitica TaxID=470096 RepID=A0A6A6W0A1_9PEZI|nr:uncharacterized protein EJ05DRAFT_487261 [Pseudovirgaria hyperparasitica]KAF2756348.1 hypothetical protein EJ05DRAFT_487261 [Pseudovirgaria hyperparasitica]